MMADRGPEMRSSEAPVSSARPPISRLAHDHAVLLVEDDADSRDALTAMLEAFGLVVCEAIDGQEALEQLAAGYRPCAILLDLMMPRMDGWKFRETQRRDPELRRLPVALMSACTDLQAHQRRLATDAAFAKPLTHLDDVIAFVDDHCACAPHTT
jgi:two-component system chemotaxis response regulator CheY